jgi:hypothetical protein
MWVTESTFQPKRIAGHKKSPKLGKQSGRPHGGYEAGPVSCLYRKSDSAIVVMKSEVRRVARSRLERGRQTVERKR